MSDKRKTVYDDFDRDSLIATLLARDEAIMVLRSRTLDDFIREIMVDEMIRCRVLAESND